MLKLLWALVLVLGVHCSQGSKPVFTHVTFLYDIKRGEVNIQKRRPFRTYLYNFDHLLATDANMIIFGNSDLREFVWKRRKEHNTVFIEKEVETFRDYWYFTMASQLRVTLTTRSPELNKLHMYLLNDYNALMFAKHYIMEEAIQYDKWNTDMLVWIDAGYLNDLGKNIVNPENVIKKFYELFQPQYNYFIYPYNMQIFHGYEGKGLLRYLDHKFKSYSSIIANNQGGYIHTARDIKNAFENLLRITLENENMCSDEAVDTIMTFRYPFLIPNVFNMKLLNYQNRFHTYEYMNRATLHPRHWRAVVKADGRLEVQQSQNLIRQSYSKSKVQEQVAITPLREAEIVNEQTLSVSFFITKIRAVLFVKKSAQFIISIVKGALFTLMLVAYLYLSYKNQAESRQFRSRGLRCKTFQ